MSKSVRLTAEQKRRVKELIEDEGLSRTEAIALAMFETVAATRDPVR